MRTTTDRDENYYKVQPEPVAPTDEELYELWEESGFENDRFARAVLARWGRPTPQPPADGEAAELAAELRHFVAGYQQMRGLDPEHVYSIHRGDAMEAHLRISRLSRIAELLERQQPQPVWADIHYAWELEDAEGEWQAGGSANSLEDVQREGNRCLHICSQDGPHKLIIQRHCVSTIEEVTNG
jgi:hypothetical protein